jgi:putative Mn2+ efflux pump MntP
MVNSLIIRSALVVGIVSYGMTLLGMVIGKKIGAVWGRRCKLFGGFFLIAIGLYILWPTLRALCF